MKRIGWRDALIFGGMLGVCALVHVLCLGDN